MIRDPIATLRNLAEACDDCNALAAANLANRVCLYSQRDALARALPDVAGWSDKAEALRVMVTELEMLHYRVRDLSGVVEAVEDTLDTVTDSPRRKGPSVRIRAIAAERDAARADLDALRAELAALRADSEKAPQPEPAASERVMWADNRLYVDGVTRGYVAPTSVGGWGVFCNGGPDDLPDEPTARAVLLALVGEDPGVTVALSLRDSWTREDVDRARESGLGWCVAPLLEVYAEGSHGTQRVKGPEVIRQWAAGGQGLMSLRVVEESADDCPF